MGFGFGFGVALKPGGIVADLLARVGEDGDWGLPALAGPMTVKGVGAG